jgi:hypothetical protein
MGKGSGVYRVLVGKHEGKGPLGRPRHRLEDNIKMYLQEVRCGLWTGLSCLKIGTEIEIGTCESGNELLGSIQ